MRESQSLGKSYDVVVAGAGPAGGECARELAKSGHDVLLLERSQVVGEPNFSSGGTTIDILPNFDLPRSIIQSTWRGITLQSLNEHAELISDKPQGYVIDYKRLKQFLFIDARKRGADAHSGMTARSIVKRSGRTVGVSINGKEVLAKVVIDATGTGALLSRQAGIISRKGIAGTGIEYFVRDAHLSSQSALQFYLGDSYATCGYMWIFPAGKGLAKVGTARLLGTDIRPSRLKMDKFIKSDKQVRDAETVDVHGGTLYFDYAPRTYVNGNVIALGDAARLCNTLGGEGIKHALASGKFAAEACSAYLKSGKHDLRMIKRYDSYVKSYTGKRWDMSYALARFGYPRSTDRNADRLVRLTRRLSPERAVDILFNYNLPSVATVLRKVFSAGA